MSVSRPLFAPGLALYLGAPAAIPTPPTVAAIAGRTYPIDLERFRHRGLPSFREGAVTSDEPGDQLFDTQGGWWRYRFRFDHGAGQDVVDLDREGDAMRFHRSRGIDPWDTYRVTLLPETESKLTVSSSNNHMIATGTRLYVADGNTVKFTANLAGTPTWTTVTGIAAEAVVGLTTDGTDCFAATTGHIYRIADGGSSATSFTSGTPTDQFTSIAFVANRLLAGDGARLVEVKAGALDVIRQHFQAAFRWTAMFAVGSRIYVGGYAGNRSEMFTTEALSDGSLTLAAEAASFFAGELILASLAYGGSVLLTTSKGVRFGTLGNDSTLQYGPLIEAAGASRCVTAEGGFAWFGWGAFPDAGTGLGRLSLTEFVDTLQPAYATDVYTIESTDPVVAVARFGGRTVFSVAGDAVYATSTTDYVSIGYLEVGEVYFGTVETKSVGEVRVQTEPLAANERITLIVSDGETGAVMASGDSDVVDSIGVAVHGEGQMANWITMRIELGGDTSSTPTLRQWRARAYPIGPAVQEFIVPFVIHSTVITADGQGAMRSFDVYREVQYLKELWQRREPVVFQIGEHAYRVRIDNFEFAPSQWSPGGDWLSGTCTVRLLSV